MSAKSLSFLVSIKAYVKGSDMLHISEFRVQNYADKGGFPLSLNLTLVFDWLNVRK